MSDITKYMSTGKRKEAVAKVQLLAGKGKIFVNNKLLDEYFLRETDRIIIKQPLEATGNLNKYDIYADVQGGGIAGQAGALRHGISRALALADANFRNVLRKGGFLTRDPRMKERKKYGRKGARKRFQWTKR